MDLVPVSGWLCRLALAVSVSGNLKPVVDCNVSAYLCPHARHNAGRKSAWLLASRDTEIEVTSRKGGTALPQRVPRDGRATPAGETLQRDILQRDIAGARVAGSLCGMICQCARARTLTAT